MVCRRGAFLVPWRERSALVPQHSLIQRETVAGEHGLQRRSPAQQILPRLLIGVLAKTPPVGIAEYIGEKHLAVVASRFEKHDVGIGIFMAVAFHPDLHARVDERPERLR